MYHVNPHFGEYKVSVIILLLLPGGYVCGVCSIRLSISLFTCVLVNSKSNELIY